MVNNNSYKYYLFSVQREFTFISVKGANIQYCLFHFWIAEHRVRIQITTHWIRIQISDHRVRIQITTQWIRIQISDHRVRIQITSTESEYKLRPPSQNTNYRARVRIQITDHRVRIQITEHWVIIQIAEHRVRIQITEHRVRIQIRLLLLVVAIALALQLRMRTFPNIR